MRDEERPGQTLPADFYSAEVADGGVDGDSNGDGDTVLIIPLRSDGVGVASSDSRHPISCLKAPRHYRMVFRNIVPAQISPCNCPVVVPEFNKIIGLFKHLFLHSSASYSTLSESFQSFSGLGNDFSILTFCCRISIASQGLHCFPRDIRFSN